MGDIARTNALAHPRSHALEYAVFGKWRRSEADTTGVHGCWYVGVPELETFGKDALNAKLSEFEAAQAAARAEASSARSPRLQRGRRRPPHPRRGAVRMLS